MDYTEIDRRADEILAMGYTPQQAWRILCQDFKEVHSGVLAERVTASAVVAGASI